MKVSFVWVNKAEFKLGLLSDLAKLINQKIVFMMPRLRIYVYDLLETVIRNSPEYQSLTIIDGALRQQLGVLDAVGPLENMIERIKDNILLYHEPATAISENIRSKLVLGMVKADYSDVLSGNDISYISEGKYADEVKWLEWLTLGGFLANFYYLSKPEVAPYSRTNSGIMIKSKLGWEVPSEFAGSENDNWILRALIPEMDNIARKIQELL